MQNAEPQSSQPPVTAQPPDISFASTQNDAVGADSARAYGDGVMQPDSSASSYPFDQGTSEAFSQASPAASYESFDRGVRDSSTSVGVGQAASQAFGEAPTAAMPVVDEQTVNASVHGSRDSVDDPSAASVHGSLGVAVTMFDAPAVTSATDSASLSSPAQPSSDSSLPPYGSPAPFFQSFAQAQGRVSEDDIPTAIPGPVQSDVGEDKADESAASLASTDPVDDAVYYGAPYPKALVTETLSAVFSRKPMTVLGPYPADDTSRERSWPPQPMDTAEALKSEAAMGDASAAVSQDAGGDDGADDSPGEGYPRVTVSEVPLSEVAEAGGLSVSAEEPPIGVETGEVDGAWSMLRPVPTVDTSDALPPVAEPALQAVEAPLASEQVGGEEAAAGAAPDVSSGERSSPAAPRFTPKQGTLRTIPKGLRPPWERADAESQAPAGPDTPLKGSHYEDLAASAVAHAAEATRQEASVDKAAQTEAESEPEEKEAWLNDIESGFDRILTEPGQVHDKRLTEAEAQEVHELFAGIAADHMRPMRDLMMEIKLGEPSMEWIDLVTPSLVSLSRAADSVELDQVKVAVDGLVYQMHQLAASGATRIEQSMTEPLLSAYERLVQQLPQAFADEEQRDRREPVIVQSLLCQVPGVRKVALTKLYAAGLTRLSMYYAAKPYDIAQTAGISEELAALIVQKFAAHREEASEARADLGRANEYAELGRLVDRLDKQNATFETASGNWASDAIAKKRTIRKERQETVLQINVVLARLGHVALVEQLGPLPFRAKAQELRKLIERATKQRQEERRALSQGRTPGSATFSRFDNESNKG